MPIRIGVPERSQHAVESIRRGSLAPADRDASLRARGGKRVFDMHVDTATFKIHQAWQAAKVELGIPPDDDTEGNVTFHTTRHEGTSRLIDSGMHFHMVQRVTGHSTVQMLNRYYHCYVRDILKEMDRIDDAKLVVTECPPPPPSPAVADSQNVIYLSARRKA